jgi:protein-tyrosine phosphatase
MTRTHAAWTLSLLLSAGFHGAAAAAVTTERVERTGPDRIAITWTDKAPVDVYVADGPDAGLDKARLVSADDRDGRYEASAASARPYFLLKDRSDGAVVRTAERAVSLQEGSNFRDLGGYPAADGKHVRWGKIFRSGATPLLTEADVRKIHSLGLADMIDLRSSEERALAPSRVTGVRYHAIGYSMGSMMGPSGAPTSMSGLGELYAQMPTFLEPQLRMLFAALLEGDGPVVYNCSAGQDRTGFASAMVLTALGVPRDVIIADYHLSTTYRRPQSEMPKLSPALAEGNPAAAFFIKVQNSPAAQKAAPLVDAQGKALLLYALEAVEQKYGSVEAYLDQALGVDAAAIAKLRSMYLE